MEIEKIFNKISSFENITLDKVFFESKYPVMFTCRNGEDVYLFICCLVNAAIVKWIGTKTSYDILIGLLENKITIRNAFLEVTEKKVIIEYDGQDVNCSIVESKDIQQDLLPADGEYMDAEDDEFSEEIAVFKLRNTNKEYKIQLQIQKLLTFEFHLNIMLTDEYFNTYFECADVMEYPIGKIQEQRVGL